MAKFRSFTSNSRAALCDLLIVVGALLAVELYLGLAMEPFENRMASENVQAVETVERYYALGRVEPQEFFSQLKPVLGEHAIVFIGDSQGAVSHGGGLPYPKCFAAQLRAAGRQEGVVSLHLGGANTYEQCVLLLAMMRAGITPEAVVWSHSIFSLRKNEVRRELANAYTEVQADMAVLAPGLSPPAATAAVSRGGLARYKFFGSLVVRAEESGEKLATLRFMRRTLWDKLQILRRSPLGRLIPTRFLPGTARKFDPPVSILEDAARIVGEVSAELVGQGVDVVNVVSPINRQVEPRPFSQRSEAISYPALAAVSQAGGAGYLNLLDFLGPESFGRYHDGTQDAFHIDADGHAAIADTLGRLLAGMPAAGGSRTTGT